jgi:hypothetical protein
MEDPQQSDSQLQLQQVIQQLLNSQKELHDRLVNTEAALEMARQNVPTPPSPAPRPPQGTLKNHILPKPRCFDGTKSKYPAWRIQMEQKLEIDGEAIALSEKGRIFFILGYLEDEATSFVEFWSEVRASSPDQDSLKNLWTELDHRFLDQQRQQKALTQWKVSRQQKQPLAEYLLEYERLERESGMSKVDTQARIMNLESRISGEILTVVMTRGNRPQDFPKYVQALQDIEADLQTLKATGALRFHPFRNKPNTGRSKTRPRSPQGQTETTNTTPPPAPRKLSSETEVMDWQPTINTNQFRGSRQRIPLPENMRKPSQKELQARKDAEACFNCGNTGHIARHCRYQRHSVRLNTASIIDQGLPRPAQFLVKEDSESENE